MKGIVHHLFGSIDIEKKISVADWLKYTEEKIFEIYLKKKVPIIVGGSGMYADAIMFGLDDFPPIPAEVRQQINLFRSTHGIKSLQELLRNKDPDYYKVVDRNNPQRLTRALEVCIASNKPYSSFLGQEKKSRPFVSKMLILHCPRKILYDNIDHRVDQMMAAGLEAEAKNNLAFREFAPLKTIGYKELMEYFDGNVSLDDAVNFIKRNTRRYAKRQITWFKKYDNAFCFPANTPVSEVYDLLNQ